MRKMCSQDYNENYYLTLVRDTFIHYICTRVIEYKEDL